VTAFATADTAIAAMKQGAYDYLTKPFQIEEINAVIGRALEKRALVEDNLALRDQLAGRARLAQLLGKSRAMHKVFEMITKIPLGEDQRADHRRVRHRQGAGRARAAQRGLAGEGAVRRGQLRRDPEELMESELFGHKRGSFTGAVADTMGMFQEANGGTLFLDEIGELSLALQVKLLRALQERKVKQVGATDEFEVDVRVIAATNRDSRRRSRAARSGPICTTGSNVIELRLPPCGIAARTSRSWRSTSCAGSRRSTGGRRGYRPRRCGGSRATSFPATCASSRHHRTRRGAVVELG